MKKSFPRFVTHFDEQSKFYDAIVAWECLRQCKNVFLVRPIFICIKCELPYTTVSTENICEIDALNPAVSKSDIEIGSHNARKSTAMLFLERNALN
jgi:hypothetical protein